MADNNPQQGSVPLTSVLPQVATQIEQNPPGGIGTDPAISSKQMMIGVGAFVVIAIILFFIRNAFVSYLVGSLKRSPNSAGMAGWALFGSLLFAAAIGCIALVSTSYLTAMVYVSLGGISLICFLMAAIIAGKK
jgi:hypothetical protein